MARPIHRDRVPAPATSVRRAVAQFALTGLVVLALFLVGSLLVFRSLGRGEALRGAKQLARLSGQGIVEPALSAGLLRGEQGAIRAVDTVVQERVLGEEIVRVKIWAADGRILYSDEPRLIGSRYPLDGSKLEALHTGVARAELSSLDGVENRYERGEGRLYEVYLPIRAPDGTPLIFETYQRGSTVAATSRRIWAPFAALLLGSLILLWLVQLPLALRLARSLRRSQEDREALLVRAVEASVDERRRIAADLHDGVVQDLAGVSYGLSAAADTPADVSPEVRTALRDAAASVRDSIRRIRSLLVEIHPPSLEAAGLEAALRDLVAPLRSQGVDVELDVAEGLELGAEEERLAYRVAAEAIRNVERHAAARRVRVGVVSSAGATRLELVDDGVGFDDAQRARRRSEGHVGLSLLEELVVRAGGTLQVRSAPGEGTSVVLEVPQP